jgi:hypothetical protein
MIRKETFDGYNNHKKIYLLVRIPVSRQGLTFTTKYVWGYHIQTNKGLISFDNCNKMGSLVMQLVTSQNYSV